jgi:hypothetical protein
VQDQSNPLETTAEPSNEGLVNIELLVTRHKMKVSVPLSPQLPTYGNDGRSTPWKLDGFQVQGPFLVCTWRRTTTATVNVEPAIDAVHTAGALPSSLQAGRPQVVEDHPQGSEQADLALLTGRVMSSAHSPSAAPPSPVPAPLPYYARERAPMAEQRNVTLRTGQVVPTVAPGGLTYEVAVRPSTADPSLLVHVPGVTPPPSRGEGESPTRAGAPLAPATDPPPAPQAAPAPAPVLFEGEAPIRRQPSEAAPPAPAVAEPAPPAVAPPATAALG